VGVAEPDHARATSLRDIKTVVPQGTMIPAVLETAMNSDLPGFVRAVVSRDVRGFDGSDVLIPRGSRLVGQYRSGLSQGASRIFVIWTRVLRPDGASVQIASPGGDPLGRAGQSGKVNNHFFENFSSAILLSIINAEITNLAAQPNTQIVIGGTTGGVGSLSSTNPGAAAATAGSSALTPPVFPPTITVRQGAPIAIFVARDLDFSTVPGLAK
jgi:type IV secretion system protein VirB10